MTSVVLPIMPVMPVVLGINLNYGFMNRPVLDMFDPNPDFSSFPLGAIGMPYYLQALFSDIFDGYPMVVLSTTAELALVTMECDRLGLPYQTTIIPPVASKKRKKPAAYRVVYLGAAVT